MRYDIGQFGVYRRRSDVKLCHIYISEDEGIKDLCGVTSMISTGIYRSIEEAREQLQLRGFNLCRKCRLVYTMKELAE